MGVFFEFLEKIRIEKMLLEQDAPQGGNPQDQGNMTAPDAPPEQQDSSSGQGEESGLSPTAHDDNFSKLIDIMKQALPDLKPENRKIVDEFLKTNNLSGGDEPKKDSQNQSQDQGQGQGQGQAPPTGMGDQSGMPAQPNQMAAPQI
jgi:hypothetical protein